VVVGVSIENAFSVSHDPTHVTREQFEATENEGAHQDLAQLRVGPRQREHVKCLRTTKPIDRYSLRRSGRSA
jgi:hypothetical protein